MKKLGLVLSGGGGKGSYEIGVWKYLKEIGLDKKISVISGTSVGGLNAALMGTEDYENAECIWKYKISRKTILTPHNKKKMLTAGGLSAAGGAAIGFNVGNTVGVMAEGLNCVVPGLGVAAHAAIVTATTAAGGAVSGLTGGAVAGAALSTVNQVVTDGLFSREGLLEIFKHVKLEKIADCKKSIYVTCTLDKPISDKVLGDKRERVSFRLNNYNSEGIKKLLLATSAIPGAFRPETIEGKKYYDGGFKGFLKDGKRIAFMDNAPLTPVADEHCTHVIVVYLDQNPQIAAIRDDHGYISSRENTIREMIEIKPSQDLGDLFDGTLNFNKEVLQRNIELGYSDAKNKYGKILEELLKEFSDVSEDKQSETEKILKKYIYDMNGINKEPVYTKEKLTSVKSEIKALIKQSSYKFKFSDVIGYISGRQMIISSDGLLFKNEDVSYYILYDEIEQIEVPVVQGRSRPGEDVDLCLSGNFSNLSGNKIVIKNNFLAPSFNSTEVRKFLNEIIKYRKTDTGSNERKEAIRKHIFNYIQKSSDKLVNFVLIQDNSTLLKKAEKSLSYCKCNLGINDILAYKDISISGNGADFFILTEEGIHYKSSGQDYYYIEYENIKEINSKKTISILDKRVLSTGLGVNMYIPKYLILDYLYDKSTLVECLEKIKQLF